MSLLQEYLSESTSIKNKRYFPAFAKIAGANLVANLFSLITGMYLVRQFTPELYGQITFLLASFGIFRLLATFGMGNRVTIDVARSISTNSRDSLNLVFYSLLLLRVFIAIALVLIAIILATHNKTYAIVAIILLPASLNDFNLAALQGGFRASLIAITIVAQPISYAFLAIPFVGYTHSLTAVYTALICSYIISMVVGLISVKYLGLRFPRIKDFNLSYAKSSLGFIGNSFILGFAQYLFSIVSLYILGARSLFSQAAQMGVIISLVYLPTSLLQLPTAAVFQARFVKIYDQEGLQSAASFLSEFLLFGFQLCVIAAVICIAFAKPIVLLLFGSQYASSSIALIILSPIMIMAVSQNIFIFTLMGLNKPQVAIPSLLFQLIFVILICSIISITANGNVYLIAASQVIGASLGTLLLFRKTTKLIPFPGKSKQYLFAIGMAILSVLIIKIPLYWTRDTLFFNFLKMALVGTIYLVLMRKRLWVDLV